MYHAGESVRCVFGRDAGFGWEECIVALRRWLRHSLPERRDTPHLAPPFFPPGCIAKKAPKRLLRSAPLNIVYLYICAP